MTSASASPSLRFAKPRTRRAVKRSARSHRAQIIAETHRLVMQRDRACRCCGSTHWPAMHEIVWRSKLRGLPPEQIFNTHNCLRLCDGPGGCHALVHANKLDIFAASARLGANGRVEFQRTLPKVMRCR